MNSIDEFKSLRPIVESLDEATRRQLKRDVFSIEASDDRSGNDLALSTTDISAQQDFDRKRHSYVLAAAAFVAVVLVVGVAAFAGANRSDGVTTGNLGSNGGTPGDGGGGAATSWVPPTVAPSDPSLPLVGAHARRDQLPFFYSRSDDERIYNAWQERIASCMDGLGFTYIPVAYMPAYGLDFVSPLDREAALLLGYHLPSDGIENPNQNSSREFTAALNQTCGDTAYAETFGTVQEIADAFDSAIIDFDESVNGWAQTSVSRTKSGEWATCMRGRGYDYSDPAEPRAEYGDDPTLTDAEVTTRLDDLACDKEVGLSEARSAYEQSVADEWIATHQDLIDDLIRQKTLYDEQLNTMTTAG